MKASRGPKEIPSRVVKTQYPVTTTTDLASTVSSTSCCPKCHANNLYISTFVSASGKMLEQKCPICGKTWPLWGVENVGRHMKSYGNALGLVQDQGQVRSAG